MLVFVDVPVEPDSVRVHFSPSGFTFSANSVPAFNMELSSTIIPERSSVQITAGEAMISLRKYMAGDWAFLDRAGTEIPRDRRFEHIELQQIRMCSYDSGRKACRGSEKKEL